MRFPVGTKFTSLGRKAPKEETVVDFHVTKNLAGKVVETRYVVSHQFLGQVLIDYVPETTIARGSPKPPNSIAIDHASV